MKAAFLQNSVRFLAASRQTFLHPSTNTCLAMSSTTSQVVGIDYPELVVFDLDACFWDQEMFEMTALPSEIVKGDLNGKALSWTQVKNRIQHTLTLIHT